MAFLKKRYWKLAKYALIEGVLIIFSVYIGLGFEANRQVGIQSERELGYYKIVGENISDDLGVLDSLIRTDSIKIEETKNLIRNIHREDGSVKKILNDYLYILRPINFIPDRIGYEAVKASAAYVSIKDIKIKAAVENFYAFLENHLVTIDRNRNEMVNRIFAYEFYDEIGWQEFDYVRKSLGEELYALYPDLDWHLDKNSKYFKSFKSDLLFFIVMREREIQLFTEIKQKMRILNSELESSVVQ